LEKIDKFVMIVNKEINVLNVNQIYQNILLKYVTSVSSIRNQLMKGNKWLEDMETFQFIFYMVLMALI
jgi:hypothetical protein